MANERVGFIGLGEIGKPMAKSLARKGFPLTVCGHVRKEPVEELRQLGAKVAGSPAELARASDIVISMVRNTLQAEEVTFGDQGIVKGMVPGKALIFMSTIAPAFVKKTGSEMARVGVSVIDAPVSGAAARAETGTLTIMVGGEPAAIERCRPVLEVMGTVYHVGNIGAGLAVKLVNNVLLMDHIFAATEALSLGVKAGVDLSQLLKIVKTSTGNSSVIERWDFISHHLKPRLQAGEEVLYKDVKLAQELATEVGISLPLADLCCQLEVLDV